MTPWSRPTWELAVLACALMVGCGATTAARSEALRDAATEYVDAMRWGRFEVASRHVPEGGQAEFIRKRRAAQSQMQIHDYEIRAVDHAPGTDRARIVIAAAWSRPSDPVVHEELLEQHWRWQKDHWVLARQDKIQALPAAPLEPGDGL